MNCRRFSRIASRPCQSATPRLHTASSAKQSKPWPNVLSSISFHMAKSHSGAAVFVKVIVFILFWIVPFINIGCIFIAFTTLCLPHHCGQKIRVYYRRCATVHYLRGNEVRYFRLDGLHRRHAPFPPY